MITLGMVFSFVFGLIVGYLLGVYFYVHHQEQFTKRSVARMFRSQGYTVRDGRIVKDEGA